MTELVLRESISEHAREYTMTIKNSGSHLLSLVNDILDLSKIESRKALTINDDHYELHSTINEVVSIMNYRITKSRVILAAYMEKDVPNRVFGDEVRLRQILLNLLNNSAKFTEKGRITLDVSWEKKEDGIGLFTMKVTDTGIGIKKENMAKLFDEFSQFDTEKNRHVEGTGLGLAITYNLVKIKGGELHAESTYGEGSVFTVVLPLKYENNGGSAVIEDAIITEPIRDDEPTSDDTLLKPLLVELKAAIKNYDIGAIDKASASLKDFITHESFGEAVGSILHNAFTSKFKQALAQIDELLVNISWK